MGDEPFDDKFIIEQLTQTNKALLDRARKAEAIVNKLMQEPTVAMSNKAVQYVPLQSRNLANNAFKAMRDQMLKEIDG